MLDGASREKNDLETLGRQAEDDLPPFKPLPDRRSDFQNIVDSTDVQLHRVSKAFDGKFGDVALQDPDNVYTSKQREKTAAIVQYSHDMHTKTKELVKSFGEISGRKKVLRKDIAAPEVRHSPPNESNFDSLLADTKLAAEALISDSQ